MAYEKQVWINHLETDDTHEVIQEGVLLEASRFNHMEDGIEGCDQAITNLSQTVNQIQETTTLIEERGFVASVVYIVDEEDDKYLKFIMSNNTELLVPLTTKVYYHVNYYDGPTLLFSDLVRSGRDSTYTTIPTRPSTPQYDYTFLGWSSASDGEVEEGLQTGIEENKNLYAIFDSEVRSYTISFVQDGEVLQEDVLEYGSTPEYVGDVPIREEDEERPFDKWIPALEDVSGNATYTASFKHRLDYYDGDTLLKTEWLSDGEAPEEYYPAKDSGVQNGYGYVLDGWTTNKDSQIPTASALDPMYEDRVLYGIFTLELLTYTVTWDLGDTTTSEIYYYGQTPTVPVVGALDGRSFNSWDKEIVPVTEDVVYTARYQRKVCFYNGGTLLTTQYVDYGKNASYTGSTPTKASTAQYTYAFSGWASSNGGSVNSTVLQNITADKDVYAAFTASIRYYTVSFYNGSTLLQTKTVAYGGTATYTGSTPTKASTAQYSYTFSGWSSSLTNITGSKSVSATFSSSLRSYKIIFSYLGGSVHKTCYYGTTPTPPEVPPYTGKVFTGWDSAITVVTGDKTYRAQYRDA